MRMPIFFFFFKKKKNDLSTLNNILILIGIKFFFKKKKKHFITQFCKKGKKKVFKLKNNNLNILRKNKIKKKTMK